MQLVLNKCSFPSCTSLSEGEGGAEARSCPQEVLQPCLSAYSAPETGTVSHLAGRPPPQGQRGSHGVLPGPGGVLRFLHFSPPGGGGLWVVLEVT